MAMGVRPSPQDRLLMLVGPEVCADVGGARMKASTAISDTRPSGLAAVRITEFVLTELRDKGTVLMAQSTGGFRACCKFCVCACLARVAVK
mmetsp:Transcript_77623/g.215693  ORF Transcript_77623/g.215693 Transcript_77623/m.215693 type:complete len:91 (+) Transcript_77623:455-727(+)